MSETPTPDGEQFDVVVTVGEDGTVIQTPDSVTIAELTAQVATLTARISDLQARVNTLINEQIDASDWRLTDMWARAAEIADEAGHCRVYDDLVRKLGGIPREREYRVTFYATQTVYVYATDEESAEDCATEMLDDSAWDLNTHDTEVYEN